MHVNYKVDSLNVVPVISGEKDCLFVTSKRETVNLLPIKSCVVTHVHFAKGYLQKKGFGTWWPCPQRSTRSVYEAR